MPGFGGICPDGTGTVGVVMIVLKKYGDIVRRFRTTMPNH
jgi:hypothetical protein